MTFSGLVNKSGEIEGSYMSSGKNDVPFEEPVLTL